MATDPTLLLKGFADLVTWWTESVAADWQEMSVKIDNGTYGPDDAMSDAAYCVALNTLGLLGAMNETMEAAGVLVFNPGPTVTSASASASSAVGQNRPLTVAGPFTALVGGGQIPATDITAQAPGPPPTPSVLPANAVGFEVFANTTGHYVSSYVGWVQVGDGISTTYVTEMVNVTLIVA